MMVVVIATNSLIGGYRNIVPILVLLLLDDVLQNAMTSGSRHRHVAVLFELTIIAFGLLRDAIAEQPSREALIMVLHRENFVKTAQVVQLVDATLVYLASELLAPHLIPKQGRLLVHFLELAVPNDSIQVFLAVSFRHAQNLERVLDHRLLDPIVKPAVRLEGGRLVDLEEPRLGVGVDEHVKSKHLKAHVKRAIVRLAGAIIVQKVGLARYERLYDQICDF